MQMGLLAQCSEKDKASLEKLDVKTVPENQTRPRCDGEKTEMVRERKREGGQGRREDGTSFPFHPRKWGGVHIMGI